MKLLKELLPRTLLLFSLLLAGALLHPLTASGRQCPKCHGSGWQTTIPDVGHYGVERTKRKCPVCGEMVFSGHKDRCTQCGGTGQVGDRGREPGNSVADRRADEGAAFFATHLTVEENAMRQAMMSSLFDTKYVVETCQACGGSGRCRQCGGVQNLSIDADVASLCRVCGGGGLCIACNGQGSTGGRTELAHSQEERDKIARNCGVYTELANLRASRGISPRDPNGPRIGIDSDGNYYIQGGASGGDAGEGGYDAGEGGFGANGEKGDGFIGPKFKKSIKKKALAIGLGALATGAVTAAAVFVIRRGRRKSAARRNTPGGGRA